MLLKQLWYFIWGYVILQVEGPALEKFINLAIERGIHLWDAARLGKTLRVKVNLGGFWALRHIARKTGCRFSILSKEGLPFFYMRLRRRKMLVLGAVFFLAALYFLASFFWFVEVRTTEDLHYLDKDRILKVARFYGLYSGAVKSKVNLTWVENGIAANLPEVAYVGVKVHGTAATIEVVERKKMPRDYQDKQPAHIVAAKDGVITEILVLAGDGKVNEGDTVRKGQLLISGIIQPPAPDANINPGANDPPAQHTPERTKAKGLVRARVWYQAYGESPVVVAEERMTGESKTAIHIVIGKKIMQIKGPQKPPYAAYRERQTAKTLPQWRNLHLPVEVISITYLEVEKTYRNLGIEGASQIALDQAWEKLRREIPKEARLENRQVEVIQKGQGIAKVRLTVETIENIAEDQSFDGEETR
ncbi:MAG: sporulation protein YqfD [Bacillota bacterium]